MENSVIAIVTKWSKAESTFFLQSPQTVQVLGELNLITSSTSVKKTSQKQLLPLLLERKQLNQRPH